MPILYEYFLKLLGERISFGVMCQMTLQESLDAKGKTPNENFTVE